VKPRPADEEVWVIETDMDDMASSTMVQRGTASGAGALDVHYFPVHMRR